MIKPRGKEREKYDFEKNIYFPLLRSADSAFFSLCCRARQSHKLLRRPPGFFLYRGLVFSFLLQQCRSHFIFLPHCTILVCCTACCNTCTLHFFLFHNYYCHRRTGHMGRNRWGNIVGSEKKTPGKKVIATCALLFLGRCMCRITSALFVAFFRIRSSLVPFLFFHVR